MLRKLQKELGIKNAALNTAFVGALFVGCHVKAAYLVDACAISPNDGLRILSTLVSCFNLASVKFVIISLNGNVFICNENMILAALGHDDTIVIDLDTDTVHPLKQCADHLSEIATLVSTATTIDVTNGCTVKMIELSLDLEHSLGGPFLAGVLLGYPIIYKALPVDDVYSNASSKLSFALLRKYCVTVYVQTTLSGSWGEVGGLFSLMEFSCPEEYFVSEGVRSHVEQFLESVQSSLDEFRALNISFRNTRIDHTVVQTEGISL